eukprot:GHVU01211051.1.p3 GENE.GHVU01211051.1~~GHVU01211051.1.p3  ORF type:complete len:110 (-),score=4.29 GHVU01211051.1:1317-1646(-)
MPPHSRRNSASAFSPDQFRGHPFIPFIPLCLPSNPTSAGRWAFQSSRARSHEGLRPAFRAQAVQNDMKSRGEEGAGALYPRMRKIEFPAFLFITAAAGAPVHDPRIGDD